MLRVRVLAPMRVAVDDQVLPAPASRRAWSLLAYLALHPGEHRRGDLAARFWPDVPDSSARQSLRSATWSLRRALGPAAGRLVAPRDEIALEGDVWVDAREFSRLVASGRFEEAVALGECELLAGFDDEWARQARVEQRESRAGVLETLAATAERDGDLGTAVRRTRRQAALDPLDESAQRRLMTRLAAAGDHGAALLAHVGSGGDDCPDADARQLGRLRPVGDLSTIRGETSPRISRRRVSRTGGRLRLMGTGGQGAANTREHER